MGGGKSGNWQTTKREGEKGEMDGLCEGGRKTKDLDVVEESARSRTIIHYKSKKVSYRMISF